LETGNKRRKLWLDVFKWALGAALLYFIFTKVDTREVGQLLGSARIGPLISALLLLIISKILAAFRLLAFFRVLPAPISPLSNLKLYLLGMFYNLFLPGGIGGDAYKGYVIRILYQPPVKRLFSILFFDRLSGMLAIFVLACVLLLFVPLPPVWDSYRWLSWVMGLLAPFGYYAFSFVLARFTLEVFHETVAYSLLVQGIQLLSVICLLEGFGVEEQHSSYLLLFLVSSIVSVLPIAPPGGIGSREITFVYGSRLLDLDQEVALGIGILFNLISALVSLGGIGYHFKRPDWSD